VKWTHLAKKGPLASSSEFVIEFSDSIKGRNFWLAAGILAADTGRYNTKLVNEQIFVSSVTTGAVSRTFLPLSWKKQDYQRRFYTSVQLNGVTS